MKPVGACPCTMLEAASGHRATCPTHARGIPFDNECHVCRDEPHPPSMGVYICRPHYEAALAANAWRTKDGVLGTPRYPDARDMAGGVEVAFRCTKGCGKMFIVVVARDRKERKSDGGTRTSFYVCPCGVERVVGIR